MQSLVNTFIKINTKCFLFEILFILCENESMNIKEEEAMLCYLLTMLKQVIV